jgi:hypothetical protein
MRALAVLRHPLSSLWLALLLLAPGIGRACDVYNLADGTMSIPQVVVGDQVYTNVVVALTGANVISIGKDSLNPAAAKFDFYDRRTGQLTIPCVVVGGTTYSNIVTTINAVISAPTAVNLPTAPMLWLNFPLADAFVGQAYNTNLVQFVSPPSQYTYAIDTLANGSPSGMTIDMNGNLSGKPIATGAIDINNWQIPKTYTFGVCAIDTISRLSTSSPCPQAAVTVRPTRITSSVVGSGTVAASPAGNSCGAGCVEGFSQGTQVTLTATPASGWTFTGWSGACSGTTCQLSANGQQAVVATFTQTVTTGTVSGSWSGSVNQPGAPGYYDSGCPPQTVPGSFTITEDANHHISGTTGGGSVLSGTRSGNSLTMMLQTQNYGPRGPYTWTWNGSTTISGPTLYYCYNLDTLALEYVGTATFSYTRN